MKVFLYQSKLTWNTLYYYQYYINTIINTFLYFYVIRDTDLIWGNDVIQLIINVIDYLW